MDLVSIVVDPIPNLMNDPAFALFSIEGRLLHRWSFNDELVIVTDARDE